MAVSESELAKARTLLGMLTAERRRRQLEEILSGLANLADIPDCGPLLPLTRHRWWQVRHEAIRVLGKCRDQRAEEALLAVLANPLDDHDRVYANASLGECGSAAAIAALAAQIHERAEDVKCSAVYALAKLGDSSTLPVFLDALNDRSPSVKWYAMARDPAARRRAASW
jgi:HEAT repeat protein